LSHSPEEADLDHIAQLIKLQHIKVENKVKGDFDHDPLAHKKTETVEEQFYDLFQQGVALSNNGDFKTALELWVRAEKLQPENPLLKMNIRILRSRLEREN
ncbi:hypothetical protein KKF84_09875, partial [Myxococcota bacterium]|nr:hypothetical protein [Myxococcota bacterium]